jgi:hypothetical protein
MLKKTLLSTTVAAVVALCAPGAVAPASAGGIKVQSIKVRPMVRPHIRPITPRARIRVLTKRLAKKKQEQNKQKNQNAAQTTVSRKVIAAKSVPLPDVPLPRPKPDLADAMNTAGPSKEQASELGQIKHLKEAIEASKGVSELALVNHPLGLPDPLNPEDGHDAHDPRQDNPAPGGPGFVTPGGAQFGDTLTGAGVDSALFAFLDNSHGTAPRNTPGNKTVDAAEQALGVTPGKIAAAIGGVASGDDDEAATLPVYNSKNTRGDVVHWDYWSSPSENAAGATEFKFRADGSSTIIQDTYRDVDGDGTAERHDRIVTEYGQNGERSETLPTVNELRNPDDAGGGDHPFHWLKEKPKTMLDVISGIGPGAMPQDPGSSQPVQSTSATPIVSRQDLVSKYDPDSANGGGTRTPLGNICTHSEC